MPLFLIVSCFLIILLAYKDHVEELHRHKEALERIKTMKGEK